MASRNSGATLRIVRGLLSQDAHDMDLSRECDICTCDFAICELDLEAAAANGDPVVTDLQEEFDSLQAHLDTLETTLKTIGSLARVRWPHGRPHAAHSAIGQALGPRPGPGNYQKTRFAQEMHFRNRPQKIWPTDAL